jgi:hypothetical protein
VYDAEKNKDVPNRRVSNYETSSHDIDVDGGYGSEEEREDNSCNFIPELPYTAHSCSRHGPAAAWLTSAWPGNVILVPKTYALLGVRVYCLSQ